MLSTVHSANDIRIVEKEATTLAQANYSVTLIAKPPLAKALNTNIHYKPLFLADMSRWKRPLIAGYQAMKMVRAQAPSIVHFHDPELIPFCLILKRKGCKIVYDVHEDTPSDILSKDWIPRLLKPFFSYAMNAIERYAARRFDAIITATPTIGARFERYGISPIIVKNYAKKAEFQSLPATQEKKYQAVYVGRISFDRGLCEMSEACKQIGIPLILAGAAEPKVIEWMAEQKHIEWWGIIEREQILSLLHESRIGLCVLHPQPNYIDALPIKLFEYMAAELPVIVSDLPAQRDIVQSAQCGLVIPPRNSAALVEALHNILDNPIDAASMGEKGRAAVFATLNWEYEEKKLVSLYKKLREL